MPEGCAIFLFPRHGEAKMESLFLTHLSQQAAQAQRLNASRDSKDGHWYARLIAANPQIVRSFMDHEDVVAKLVEDKEVDTLFAVAAGGRLDPANARIYRSGFQVLTA